MKEIVRCELQKDSANEVGYNDQRTLIGKLFDRNDPKYAYNIETILMRLVVIDSLYSTGAGYSYQI